MDHMSMVGFTHRGVGLTVLERLAVPRGERGLVLGALRDAGCREAVLLSTCSRVEVYVGPDAGDVERAVAVLGERAGIEGVDLQAVAEVRWGDAVVEHLFRVSAGLDSRVLGEVEIQGQVRTAFREAQAAAMCGPELGRVFSAALRCGTRVRAATALGGHGRSVGQRAVDVGLAALADAVDPDVMVIGSGRMASSAVRHLHLLGRRPSVAARDEVAASRLVGAHRVVPLSELGAGVQRVDLLICATAAAHDVVTPDHVRTAARSRSCPMVVVDLSVPRNVDVAVAALPGVRLIDLRGMEDPAGDAGLAAALEAGATLVGEAVRRHAEASAARRAGPVIAELRRHVEDTCLAVLSRNAPRTATADDLASAARAVAGTLLHRPTLVARAAAAAGDTAALGSLCDLFGVQVPAEALRWVDGASPAPAGAVHVTMATAPFGHEPVEGGGSGAAPQLHRDRAGTGRDEPGRPRWSGSYPCRTG